MTIQIHLSDTYKSCDSGMRALYKLHTALQDSFGREEWKILDEEYQDVLSLFEDYDPMENLSIDDPFLYTLPMTVNIFKGKKQRALDFLERAADADQVTYVYLDYWAIFDYLVDEPRFQQVRQKLELKVSIA